MADSKETGLSLGARDDEVLAVRLASSTAAFRAANEADWTWAVCNYLQVILLAAIGIAVSFVLRRQPDISAEAVISLVVRLLAAFALYAQVNYYRKKILNRIPETDLTRFATLLSGLAVAALTFSTIFLQASWLVAIGFMMLVVSIRNAISWILLARRHADNPMRSTFGRWTVAAAGYALAILAISPIHYTLKMLPKQPLLIPFSGWTASSVYIDLIPGVALCIAMVASIQRLKATLNSD
jgi:hypothetical protein